jgi:hypothetical protein
MSFYDNTVLVKYKYLDKSHAMWELILPNCYVGFELPRNLSEEEVEYRAKVKLDNMRFRNSKVAVIGLERLKEDIRYS